MSYKITIDDQVFDLNREDIQALDLIGRKTLRDGGEGVKDLLTELAGELTALRDVNPTLVDSYLAAIHGCGETAKTIFAQFQSDAHYVGSVAFNMLMQYGTVVAGALLAKAGLIAQQKLNDGSDEPFYRQKVATANFYKAQILPRASAYQAAVMAGHSEVTALGEEDFDIIA